MTLADVKVGQAGVMGQKKIRGKGSTGYNRLTDKLLKKKNKT